MKVTTRSRTDEDKDFVRDVHHSGYHDVVVAQFGHWDQAVQDQYFEKKWLNGNLKILLTESTPCGFTNVDYDNNEVILAELVVHPKYQGRGIGTAFLEQLIAEAESRGVPIRLQVLLKNRAIDLYRKLGFTEYDKTETHVLMQKGVGEPQR